MCLGVLQVLQVSGDGGGVECVELDPAGIAPIQELGNIASIRFACVRVFDVGGEELEESPGRSLAGGSDDCRNRVIA
jgi:hypothetical protein